MREAKPTRRALLFRVWRRGRNPGLGVAWSWQPAQVLCHRVTGSPLARAAQMMDMLGPMWRGCPCSNHRETNGPAGHGILDDGMGAAHLAPGELWALASSFAVPAMVKRLAILGPRSQGCYSESWRGSWRYPKFVPGPSHACHVRLHPMACCRGGPAVGTEQMHRLLSHRQPPDPAAASAAGCKQQPVGIRQAGVQPRGAGAGCGSPPGDAVPAPVQLPGAGQHAVQLCYPGAPPRRAAARDSRPADCYQAGPVQPPGGYCLLAQLCL